jgi:hypothetical protein
MLKIKSKFEMAIDFVLPREGGYVNDINDPGGETNFGISKKKYPDLDIKNLTVQQAVEIYRRDYWDRYSIGYKYSLPFCVAVFDSYVQHRPEVVDQLIIKSLINGDLFSVQKLITARRDYYGSIIEKNPNLQKFLANWTIRLNKLAQYCGEIEQTIALS